MKKYLAAVAAGILMACGTARATQPKKPRRPTASQVQLWNEAVYTNAVTANQAQAWYAAAFWNQIELLAEYYAPPSPPVVPAPQHTGQRSSSGTSHAGPGGATGACGGATNGADAYIARESGGNPNAHNPSGATGCYQIMPGTWAGSCSDLGSQQSASTGAQAQCASRLPLSAWSASGPT